MFKQCPTCSSNGLGFGFFTPLSECAYFQQRVADGEGLESYIWHSKHWYVSTFFSQLASNPLLLPLYLEGSYLQIHWRKPPGHVCCPPIWSSFDHNWDNKENTFKYILIMCILCCWISCLKWALIVLGIYTDVKVNICCKVNKNISATHYKKMF